MGKLFDGKGMLIIPSPPEPHKERRRKALVVKECYCQNGHSLIYSRAVFNRHRGIRMGARRGGDQGSIVVSPIYGENSRIAMDIDMHEGERYELFCPECGEKLPVYLQCPCGGDIIALFTNDHASMADCVGICDRAGCAHAEVRSGNEIIGFSMIETFDAHTI